MKFVEETKRQLPQKIQFLWRKIFKFIIRT